VGVQIVARKHEEEKVWAIACIVENILQTAGYGCKTRYGDEAKKEEGI
jgi:hypothetical protein